MYDKNPIVDQAIRLMFDWRPAEAAALLRAAADRGDAAAMRVLGTMYRKGSYDLGPHVKPDVAQAIEWFEKAVALGDGESMVELSQHYHFGDGVPEDLQRAMELCERAGESGAGRGYFILAQYYEIGPKGVTVDLARAVDYYQRAIEGDFPCALTCLGRLYLSGEGVEKDEARGLALLERAVAADNSEGLMMLGEILEGGFAGQTPNPERALKLYRRAARLGYEKARRAIRRFPPIVPLGQIACSPGVAGLPQEDFAELVARHKHGDWSDVDPDQWDQNDAAVVAGKPVVSIHVGGEMTVVIQTDGPRRSTYLSFADEDGNDYPIDVAQALRGLVKVGRFYHKVYKFAQHLR